MPKHFTGLPNKACPRLRDLATAPARRITQPRTNLIREPCTCHSHQTLTFFLPFPPHPNSFLAIHARPKHFSCLPATPKQFSCHTPNANILYLITHGHTWQHLVTVWQHLVTTCQHLVTTWQHMVTPCNPLSSVTAKLHFSHYSRNRL